MARRGAAHSRGARRGARLGSAWRSAARRGATRCGSARRGHSTARRGAAWRSTVLCGAARRSVARCGWMRLGFGRCAAWRSSAPPGAALRAAALQGMARHCTGVAQHGEVSAQHALPPTRPPRTRAACHAPTSHAPRTRPIVRVAGAMRPPKYTRCLARSGIAARGIRGRLCGYSLVTRAPIFFRRKGRRFRPPHSPPTKMSVYTWTGHRQPEPTPGYVLNWGQTSTGVQARDYY